MVIVDIFGTQFSLNLNYSKKQSSFSVFGYFIIPGLILSHNYLGHWGEVLNGDKFPKNNLRHWTKFDQAV